MTNNTDRIRLLHDWYCKATNQRITLDMGRLMQWEAWIVKGFNGEDLRRVLQYLRGQVLARKRNEGCIKLSCLLDPVKFEEDLGLSMATKSGFFDPDKRLPKSPDAQEKREETLKEEVKQHQPENLVPVPKGLFQELKKAAGL